MHKIWIKKNVNKDINRIIQQTIIDFLQYMYLTGIFYTDNNRDIHYVQINKLHLLYDLIHSKYYMNGLRPFIEFGSSEIRSYMNDRK